MHRIRIHFRPTVRFGIQDFWPFFYYLFLRGGKINTSILKPMLRHACREVLDICIELLWWGRRHPRAVCSTTWFAYLVQQTSSKWICLKKQYITNGGFVWIVATVTTVLSPRFLSMIGGIHGQGKSREEPQPKARFEQNCLLVFWVSSIKRKGIRYDVLLARTAILLGATLRSTSALFKAIADNFFVIRVPLGELRCVSASVYTETSYYSNFPIIKFSVSFSWVKTYLSTCNNRPK